MEEVNSKEILEVLNKIKDSKEFSEKLQTKILEIKDAPSEEKAKKIFLKELSSAAKKLGYNLSEADFENYFKSKEGELSDDTLAQASGGKNNFWSWLAVGAGTLAGGIGMLASGLGGSLGGLFGGGSGGNTDTRPQSSYTQNIDRNRGKSVSDNVFKNTGEEKKSDEQTRSPGLNGGQGYGRYNSSSRLRSTPKKITSKYKSSKIKTSPSINLTKTKDATNAKTAEKKKEKKDNKAVIDVKKAIAKKKDENKQKKPEVKVVKVVDNNKKEAEKNLKELQANFNKKMETLEKGKDGFIKAVDNELVGDDNKNYTQAYEFIDIYGQAKSEIDGMKSQCETLGVKFEEKVKDELEKWKKLEGAIKAKREDAAEKFKEKIKNLDTKTTTKITEAKNEATERLKKISDSYENEKQENEKTVNDLKNACEEEVKKLEKIYKKYEEDRETPAKWYLLMSNKVADKDAGLEDVVAKKIETEKEYFESLSKKYVVKVEEENNAVIQNMIIEQKEEDNQKENKNKNNQINNIDEKKDNKENKLQKEKAQEENQQNQEKKEEENEININEEKKEENNPKEEKANNQINNIVEEEDDNKGKPPEEEQKQELQEKENPQDQQEKQNKINIIQVEKNNEIIEEKKEEEKNDQIGIVKNEDDKKNKPQEAAQEHNQPENENQQGQNHEEEQDKIVEEDNKIIGKEKEKEKEEDDDMGLEALFNVTGSCEYLKNKIEEQTKKVEDASKDLGDLEKAKAYQQEALEAQKQLEDFKTILGQLDENEGKKTEFSNFYKTNLDTIKVHLSKVKNLSVENVKNQQKIVNEKISSLLAAAPKEGDKKDYEKVKKYEEAGKEAEKALQNFKTALDELKKVDNTPDRYKDFDDFYTEKYGVVSHHKDEAEKMISNSKESAEKEYTGLYDNIKEEMDKKAGQLSLDITKIKEDVNKTDIEKMKAEKEKQESYKSEFEKLKKEADKKGKPLKETLKTTYGIDITKFGRDIDKLSDSLGNKAEAANERIQELGEKMQEEQKKLQKAAESKLQELDSKETGSSGKALEDLATAKDELIKAAEEYAKNQNDNTAKEGHKKASENYVEKFKVAEESLKDVEKAIEDFGEAERIVTGDSAETTNMKKTLQKKGTGRLESLKGGDQHILLLNYNKDKEDLAEKTSATKTEQTKFDAAVKNIENEMKSKDKLDGHLLDEIKGLVQLNKDVEDALKAELKIAEKVSEASKNGSNHNDVKKYKAEDAKKIIDLQAALEKEEGQVKKNAKAIEDLYTSFFEEYQSKIIVPLEEAMKEKEKGAAKEAPKKYDTKEECEKAYSAWSAYETAINEVNGKYSTLAEMYKNKEGENGYKYKLATNKLNELKILQKEAAQKKSEFDQLIKKKTLEDLIKEGSAYDKAKKAYNDDQSDEEKQKAYRSELDKVIKAINNCELAGVDFGEKKDEYDAIKNEEKLFENEKKALATQVYQKDLATMGENNGKLRELIQKGVNKGNFEGVCKNFVDIYNNMVSTLQKHNLDKDEFESLINAAKENVQKVLEAIYKVIADLVGRDDVKSAVDGNAYDLYKVYYSENDNVKNILEGLKLFETEKTYDGLLGYFVSTGTKKVNVLGGAAGLFFDNKKSANDFVEKFKKGEEDLGKLDGVLETEKTTYDEGMRMSNRLKIDNNYSSFTVDELVTLSKAKSKVKMEGFKSDVNYSTTLERIFAESVLIKTEKSGMLSALGIGEDKPVMTTGNQSKVNSIIDNIYQDESIRKAFKGYVDAVITNKLNEKKLADFDLKEEDKKKTGYNLAKKLLDELKKQLEQNNKK